MKKKKLLLKKWTVVNLDESDLKLARGGFDINLGRKTVDQPGETTDSWGYHTCIPTIPIGCKP